MKNVITLTKTLILALLVTVSVQAAATNNDDSSKCKKECCKKHKSDKQVEQAMKDLENVIVELKAEIAAMNFAEIKADVAEAIAVAPVKVLKTGNRIIIVTADEPKVCNKSKIDVQKMNKEMDEVQENMSQMDPSLKSESEKTRKTAEEILLTGIKA